MTKRREREHVDDQSDRADDREQHEADRHEAAAGVMGDESEEIDADERRQFRLAREPRAKNDKGLDDLQFPAARTG